MTLFVNDGHVVYYDSNDDSVSTDKKYDEIKIALTANKERFIEFRYAQDGQTDYFTFCQQAAQSGIKRVLTSSK
jgi:uncharacterized protein YbcV (DUF1398 family)